MRLLAYRKWLMPSLLSRMLFCFRMAVLAGVSSVWMLREETRDLLLGGILTPVIAIVVGSETTSGAIYVASHALCGVVWAVIYSTPVLLLTADSAILTGVALFLFCFITVLLHPRPLFRKISFAVGTVSLLIAFQLGIDDEPKPAWQVPLEVGAASGIGAVIGVIVTACVFPVSEGGLITERLRVGVRRSMFTQLKLISMFFGHSRSVETRFSKWHNFGARDPIIADVVELQDSEAMNVASLKKSIEIKRFLLSMFVCRWTCCAAKQRLARQERYLQLLIFLGRLSTFMLRCEERLQDTDALQKFATRLGPLMLNLADASSVALDYALSYSRTDKTLMSLVENMKAALDELLLQYSEARPVIWKHVTSEGTDVAAANVADVEPLNGLLFGFVRATQRTIGAVQADVQEEPGRSPPIITSVCSALKRFPVSCSKAFSSANLRFALQVSTAVTLASILTLVTVFRENLEFTFWAPLTVAFVAGDTVGSTFKTSFHRFEGTTAGSIFAYLAVEQVGTSRPWLLALLLAFWVGLTSYIRTSPGIEYAGTVAGFTAAIVMLSSLDRDDEGSDIAFIRIEQTSYGIVIYLIVANVLFAKRAVTIVKDRTIVCLKGAAKAVKLSIQNYETVKELYHKGPRCTAAGLAQLEPSVEELNRALTTFESQYSGLPALIDDASSEPTILSGHFGRTHYDRMVKQLGAVRRYCRGLYHSVLWMRGELSRQAQHTSPNPRLDPHSLPASSPLRPLGDTVFSLLFEDSISAPIFHSLEDLCHKVLKDITDVVEEPSGSEREERIRLLAQEVDRLSALNASHERFYLSWIANFLEGRLPENKKLPSTLETLSLNTVVFCVHSLSRTIVALSSDSIRSLRWGSSDPHGTERINVRFTEYRNRLDLSAPAPILPTMPSVDSEEDSTWDCHTPALEFITVDGTGQSLDFDLLQRDSKQHSRTDWV